MGVLETMKMIAELLPDTAAVEIAISEGRVRMRIAVHNHIIRRTWEKSLLELTDCCPASPEKMILGAAQEMIRGDEVCPEPC